MKRLRIGSKVAFVDDEDYEVVRHYSWWPFFRDGRNLYYAYGPKVNGKTLYMHRLIMGNPEGSIDHIDGNGLNNQKANLRVCTPRQNLMNRGKQVNNTSGYKGVSKIKGRRKWTAQIKVMGKKIHLGCFDEKVEAAKAYNEAAIEYFGEYAYLNEFHN